MIQTFNLIKEGWIPCETQEGEVVELSLRDTLVYAHQLKGIHGNSPLEIASLYRLLLAVLHRVFGPKDKRTWFALWRAGQWDSTQLDAYFSEWYDRFDILHPDEKRRFYQRKPIGGKVTPVLHLIHSSGNNPALFSHVTDYNQPGATPAGAARALVTAQTFRVGGLLKPGVSGPDSPCARGVCFLLEGQNLFETLASNLIQYPKNNTLQQQGIIHTEYDCPAWELDDPYGEGRSTPNGYLDYLTWQSYRIWLEQPNQDGLIRQVQLGLGQPKLDYTVLDPMKYHRAIKKTSQNPAGYTPMRFREDRALWRDSAALLQVRAEERGGNDRQPLCIRWVSELLELDTDLDQPAVYLLMALGMANDQARIDFYRHERMPIPYEYFRMPELVSCLSVALKDAEEVSKALDGALYSMAECLITPEADMKEGRKPAPEDVRNLLTHWAIGRYYWGSIEPAFWQFVNALPKGREEALIGWKDALSRAVWEAFDMAEVLAGADGRAFKAAARGRAGLARRLSKMQKEVNNG